jgi:predicted AlkP superfamily pyrophosphatase or phosphodiesterase
MTLFPRLGFPRFPLVAMGLAALASLASGNASSAARDTAAPPKRVLIISVDGLRPDLALRGDCPNLRDLMARGSFTMWAQTTPSGKTLPSHTSMLTGRTVPVHGIHWNSAKKPAGVEYTYTKAPTLFSLAKQAGYSTALIAGKSKFLAVAEPGTVDHVSLADDTAGDQETTEHALRLMREHQPQVMFFHLPDTDSTGHGRGWGSPQQMRAIANADRCIGRLLTAMENLRVLDDTLIIVSADHGGWLKDHNGSDPRGRTIPWIAAGPGVVAGQDLTLVDGLAVQTEDTFATACTFLGVALPPGCEGKPVMAIFASSTPPDALR